MKKAKLFIDSDVIISSLISTSGAAYYLLNKTNNVELSVSNYSLTELDIVVKRLRLNKDALDKLIKQKFKVLQISLSLEAIKKKYKEFTTDINDLHIVAGAKQGKVKFLVSYNLRHFYSEKLKSQLDMILITPAKMMQYLRSL